MVIDRTILLELIMKEASKAGRTIHSVEMSSDNIKKLGSSTIGPWFVNPDDNLHNGAYRIRWESEEKGTVGCASGICKIMGLVYADKRE